MNDSCIAGERDAIHHLRGRDRRSLRRGPTRRRTGTAGSSCGRSARRWLPARGPRGERAELADAGAEAGVHRSVSRGAGGEGARLSGGARGGGGGATAGCVGFECAGIGGDFRGSSLARGVLRERASRSARRRTTSARITRSWSFGKMMGLLESREQSRTDSRGRELRARREARGRRRAGSPTSPSNDAWRSRSAARRREVLRATLMGMSGRQTASAGPAELRGSTERRARPHALGLVT